jgi:hypothetical protein
LTAAKKSKNLQKAAELIQFAVLEMKKKKKKQI